MSDNTDSDEEKKDVKYHKTGNPINDTIISEEDDDIEGNFG